MTFRIEWEPKPFKIFKKLQKNIAIRIDKKLDELIENPFRFLEHFEGRNSYKFRVGRYRFLIKINVENKLLTIENFDNRGRVYSREEMEEYCGECKD